MVFSSVRLTATHKNNPTAAQRGHNRFAFCLRTSWVGAENNNGAYVLESWAMRLNKGKRANKSVCPVHITPHPTPQTINSYPQKHLFLYIWNGWSIWGWAELNWSHLFALTHIYWDQNMRVEKVKSEQDFFKTLLGKALLSMHRRC